ncbi:MAG: hypothetical protein ACYCUY_01655 [Acidithiobacillus sp.]
MQLYPFPSGGLTWMLWGVYLVGLCGAVILSFQARQQISPAVKVLLAFSGLSIGIIATAFVLTNFAHGIWASRFLVNVFYLAIVALVTFGAVRWFAGSNLTKLLLLITLIGYVMFGFAAIDHANWRYTSNWAGTHSLAKWFVTHNLYHGYGQYFEAGAPLLDIASNERITARPLSCNTGYLIPRLSSGDDQFWFGAAALPSSQTPQFVVFAQADPKWARCTIKSFGNPAMKLKHGALDIWVYRHDLSQPLIMAHDDFKHKWMLMNIANNRKAITKVGTTLGISSGWAQNAYTWLLKKGIAQ